MMTDSIRVAVAIPSRENWYADFAMCLLNMYVYVAHKPIKGYRSTGLKILNKRGSILPQLREELVELAIERACTHVLFIDSDQTFPADLVHRLAAHHVKVVACNIAVKTIPSQPTARNKSESWIGGDVVYSDLDKHGLERVWRVGTGVMLIDIDVFKKLPKPWFPLTYRGSHWEGEDWGFCQRLDDADIPIYVDHDLSREIGHLGTFNFTHDVIGEVVNGDSDE